LLIPLALYLVAAAALLSPWPFASLPAWAYNWEGYTAWRWSTYWERPVGPTSDIWAPNDGLMTDSGQGPLVGLPAAAGIAVVGFTIDAFRVPVTLLAAAAPPLLWSFARPIAGSGPALLAGLLLMTSPAFLLYGRTSTLVGVSLVPLLLTAIALRRVVTAPSIARWSWQREGVLVATLPLGIFAYAPVRLLWPLTIAFLGIVALCHHQRRTTLAATALLCALAVPLALMALEQFARAEPDPQAAALGYFSARGEQLATMSGDPAQAWSYVREPDTGPAASWGPLRQLVVQNSADLGRLLLDRETRPVVTEYWNERGRFWPWFLLPFGVYGAVVSLWRGSRSNAAQLLPVFLAAGLLVPLILTSRVHVGRMLPALPFALLVAAVGIWIVASQLSEWTRPNRFCWTARGPGALLAFSVLVPALLSAHSDLQTLPTPTRESHIAAVMAAWQGSAVERGGAVLVEDPSLGDEIEAVRAVTYRLELDPLYQFVDLQRDEVDDLDSRPPLFWRGALGALATGQFHLPCGQLWFVTPEVAGRFLDAWRSAGCTGSPDIVVLP
jgi:hypothetical protein